MRADDLDAVDLRARRPGRAARRRRRWQALQARAAASASSARLGLRAAKLRAAADAAGKNDMGDAVPLEQRSQGRRNLSSARSSCSKDRAESALASPCTITTNGLVAVRCQAFGDIDRQPAASGDDGRPCRRAELEGGRGVSVVVIVAVVRPRAAAERRIGACREPAMKSMISRTIGESANSALDVGNVLADGSRAVEDHPVGFAQRVDFRARHRRSASCR